jgi:tRNA threonylcarbamoyladenosine biosynthesis protein TsaB
MKLLAIDTSTERASLALLCNGEISSAEQPAMRQHAQLILPMIDTLLVDAGIGIKHLDGIVFGRGPGSFTGLRIACSVAKGLAFAHDLPLFPVSSLETIASDVFMQNLLKSDKFGVLAAIDARMTQLYWAYYAAEGLTDGERVSSVSDICINDNLPLILAGVGYHTYLEQLPLAISSRIIHNAEIYPTGKAMLRIAGEGRLTAVSAAAALPVYVRNQVIQGATHG